MILPPAKLKVTVSKTSDGRHDYMQIVSEDQVSLNIVVIAGRIEIQDARPQSTPTRTREKGDKNE